jgi:hypothetical protein
MVPVPHRNTINFLGMQPKKEYLIWRESRGVFTALDKKGMIRAWVIGTGKITKSDITTNSINLKDYALF